MGIGAGVRGCWRRCRVGAVKPFAAARHIQRCLRRRAGVLWGCNSRHASCPSQPPPTRLEGTRRWAPDICRCPASRSCWCLSRTTRVFGALGQLLTSACSRRCLGGRQQLAQQIPSPSASPAPLFEYTQRPPATPTRKGGAAWYACRVALVSQSG